MRWIVVLLACTAACIADVDVRDNARIDCSTDGQCPEPLVCASSGICITPAAAAEDPPAIVSVDWSREAGTVNSSFVVTFNVSKALRRLPDVRLRTAGREVSFTFDEASSDTENLIYVFSYTSDGSEGTGVNPVSVDLEDVAGNRAPGLSLGNIELDFAAPRLVVSTVSSLFARVGLDIVAELTFDESLNGNPVLRAEALDGSGGFNFSVEAGATAWQFLYTPTGTQAETSYRLMWSATDPAGNSATDIELPQKLTLDFTTPIINSALVNPELARPTQVVRVVVEVSEPPTGEPRLLLRQPDKADITFEIPQILGNNIVFLHEAQSQEDGAFDLILTALEDRAGNISADTSVGTLTLDSVEPGYLNFSGGGTYTGADTLLVSFEVNEALVTAPSVRLRNTPLTWVSGVELGPYVYALDLGTTSFNGDVPIFLELTDIAGNRAFHNPAAASLDTAAPEVIDVVFSPPTSRNNIVSLLTVTMNEKTTVPVLNWASPPGDPGFTFFNNTGLNYSYRLEVNNGVLPNTYTLNTVDAVDNAGNIAAGLAVSRGFRVDNAPPTFTSAARVDRDPAPFYSDSDDIVVTFSVNESMATDFPVVSLVGGVIKDLSCTQSPPLQYTCSLIDLVDAGVDTEGTAAINIQLSDEAGNIVFESLPVELDFTPPQMLPSPGADSFKLGDTITFSVSFAEPLAASNTPTLEVFQDGVSQGNFFGPPIASTGRLFVYGYDIADCGGANPCALDGNYVVNVGATDRAGNSVTAQSPDSFVVDASPPIVNPPPSSGSINAAQSPYKAGDRVSVTFGLSNDIGSNVPVARVNTSIPIPLSCTVSGALWTCIQGGTLQGTEVLNTQPTGSPVEIHVFATDDAGNATFSSTTVVLDFTAPTVIVDTVDLQLIPDGSNLLFSKGISTAGVGTTIQVNFVSDEPLVGLPTLRSAPRNLGWSVSGTGNHVGTHTLSSAAIPQGAYTLSVTLVDMAGNSNTLDLAPNFMVDTVPPPRPAVDIEGRIILTRAPWGSSASETPLSISAGAGSVESDAWVFAYDNADTTAPSTGLLGQRRATSVGGFGSAGAQSNFSVTGGDLVSLYITAVDQAGNSSDDDNVALNGVQATEVRDVDWIASLGGKRAGDTFSNPHRFTSRPHYRPSFFQRGSAEQGDDAFSSLGAQDGLLFTSETAGYWVREQTVVYPHRRFNPAMVYDSSRGRMVMYGGSDNSFSAGCAEGAGTRCVYTWEWDGARWYRVIPIDPEGDGNPVEGAFGDMAMAFDSRRQVTVLVIAQGPDMIVWEYNGVSWAKACPSSACTDPLPGGLSGFAMTYDAGRGVTVLYGGGGGSICNNFSTTWEWDGVRWHQRDLGDPEADGDPPGIRRHSMVYDSKRQLVYMWGGSSQGCARSTDLWVYNGGSWRRVTPSGGPSNREYFGMSYDDKRDRVVVYGGFDGLGNCDGSGSPRCEGTWEYNPATQSWSPELCTSSSCRPRRPQARSAHAMAYDTGRGVSVIFGGSASPGYCDAPSTYDVCQTTSEWNGFFWTPRGPSDPQWDGNPGARRDPALSFGHYYNTLWMFGGWSASSCEGSGGNFCRYMWGFDGGSWRRTTPSGSWPTARSRASMVGNGWTYQYMFGGENTAGCGEGTGNYCATLWRWNNSSWTALSPGGFAPTGRYGAAMAYDTSRGDLLVVGGYGGSTPGYLRNGYRYDVSANTWTWVDFCLFCSVVEPPALIDSGLVYDARRDRYVLFGGAGPGYSGGSQETWELNPTNSIWTRACTTSPCADNIPGPRWKPFMWYDTRTRRVVMGNGANNDDLWTYDGSVWRESPLAAVSDDFEPARGHSSSASTYDSRRYRGVVFGGAGINGGKELWFHNSIGNTVPAHAAYFSFGSSGIQADASLRTLTTRSYSGADSSNLGSTNFVNGVGLYYRGGDSWRLGGTNAAGPTAPGLVSTTLSGPQAIESMFTGPGEDIGFLVRGLRDGSGSGPALTSTDYMDMTVRYRLPGLCTNDVEGAAIVVNSNLQTFNGDTCLCSDDFAPSCAAGGSADAVYTLDVPSTGSWNMDAEVSGFDSVLYLRGATPVAGDVLCDDNSGAGNNARLQRTLLAGQRYYLIVDAKSGNCGSYQLRISF